MLQKPQLLKGLVGPSVREIQRRQDELKRVQHGIESEEERKLKTSNTAAGGSVNQEYSAESLTIDFTFGARKGWLRRLGRWGPGI